MHVLITYATEHGSTVGVAQRIAARLSEQGHDTEVHPVDQVDDLAPYEAVVIGSAVHDQAWMPAAAGFVRDHEAELAARPVWAFSVGMPAALPRPLRRGAGAEEEKIIAALGDGFSPRSDHLFSGVVRAQQFPRVSRVVLRLVGTRYGDHRDWAAIDAWAAQIGDQLQPTG